MELFARMDGMMNGDNMMSGMLLIGLLWIVLLLVLITLGIMSIVILYRRYFRNTAAKTIKEKKQ